MTTKSFRSKTGRTVIAEFQSGFYIFDTATDQDYWMSDGTDMFFDEYDETVYPGSDLFYEMIQKELDEYENELREAYFGL